MKLSIERTTLLAIAIPMAALLLVGYVSYKNTIQFIQWDALGDRINLTIQKLEHLISTITDAQTYERSFIITGRVNYLQPYNSAVRDIHNQLANLNMLMADGPANQQRLNELNILKGLIEAKLAELNQAITLRQSNRINGINVALPMILSNSTKIRATALDIQNQQNSIMSSATEQSEAYAQILIQTIIIATLVAAAITGVWLFVINRGMRKRHLSIQRSLQAEVKKRTEDLQIANNQLLLANEQLKVHDRMQQEFINVAAHELRTPIQPILGITQILRSRTTDSRQQELIHIVIRNAKRLNKLTDEILDVTKFESNTFELKKERFNLNDIILHAIDDIMVGKEISSKSPQLLYEPHNVLLQADKSRIAAVISNLLSNAIKFTQKGTITISVEDKANENNRNWVTVSVKDTGNGIHPEILPRLFSKFASKSFQGTGLGLFISKNIIEAHGGKIWGNNNADGIGATFSFSLPTL